jgi:hypothetical protein
MKRYDPTLEDRQWYEDTYQVAEMEERQEGSYVLYEDTQKEINALKAQVEQLSILCLAYEDKLPFPIMSKELFEPVFKARTLLSEIKTQAEEDAIGAFVDFVIDNDLSNALDAAAWRFNQLRRNVGA